MDIELGSAGDEWVGAVATPITGGGYDKSVSVDISNLPNDKQALVQELLNAITHGEAKSPDGYNNGSKTKGLCKGKANKSRPRGGDIHPPVTQRTPRQIIAQYKSTTPCNVKLFATGLWQTIPSTLNEAMQAPHLKQYMDKPYTVDVQREVAIFLLFQKESFSKFMKGKASLDEAQYAIAKIWASVAVPTGKKLQNGQISDGTQSMYGGGNRASSESTAMVRAILLKLQQVQKSGS